MTVTFIGHSDASEKIAHLLEEIIVKLIENHNADTFYVGVNGNFDNIVSHILVSYVRRTYGGAFKIREIAKAKGKIIIDI